MKIIFLDIDGVCNCYNTPARWHGMLGIDPDKAALVKRILKKTGAEIVLSSTWRLSEDSRAEVRRVVGYFFDYTPTRRREARGVEISTWLGNHQARIEKYAILDDDPDAFEGHPIASCFLTDFYGEGLTPDIAEKVIFYLGKLNEVDPEPTKEAPIVGSVEKISQ